jgi:hypothetical protein
VLLICYDGSRDAKEAIARGAPLLRGQRATVTTVWSPFDAAALGLSGGVEDMQESDEAGRSLRPRLGVPRACLGAFIAGIPGLVALWALGGLYLSLGPSLAGSITGSHNLLWGGAVIVLLAGVGSLSSLLFRNSAPADAVLWGALALLAGVSITVGGIEAPSAVLFLLGTAVAGVG